MANPSRLRDLVDASNAVRAATGRLGKRDRMAQLFMGLEPHELRLAASYLAGEIPQRSLNVGWSTLRAAARSDPASHRLPLLEAMERAAADASPEGAVAGSPTLLELDTLFDGLKHATGPGAARLRARLLTLFLERLTPDEREFLSGLLLGELRQGALRAVVLDALALALELETQELRLAVNFAGSFGEVAEAAARDGAAALMRFGPRPLVPIEPMLAATAETVEEALSDLETAAVEWKLDGVRVQVHRRDDDVRVFTRALRDVTASVPGVVALALGLEARSFILDGELVGLGPDGRALPFQDLMSQLARAAESGAARLEGVFFDVLYMNDQVLVEQPYRERRTALEQVVPAEHRIQQRVVTTAAEAREVFDTALAAGHEGVVVKTLEGPYMTGSRGAHWRKVKQAVTLDLVILAAEWGHGRRRGLLSNLHLGARDAVVPEHFYMLGKTFKGLTDSMLRELTADLTGLETRRDVHTVYMRPERVVEVAFDSVQRSSRYDSGFALRFARVKRFRPDKLARAASTLDEVRALHARR